MDRLDFIKRLSLLGLGVSALGFYSACGKRGTSHLKETSTDALFFKLSLAQWSIHKMIFSQQISPYDFAAKAHEWGFDGLEYVSILYRGFTADNQLGPTLDKAGLDKMIKQSNNLAEKYQLKNLLIMIDEEGDMADHSAQKSNEAVNNHQKWVETAAAMGCHSIRVNLFGSLDVDVWKERSIESLAKLSDYAKPYNINVVVENHGYFSSNARLVMEVMEHVNRTNCGTLPDFGNFCLRRENNERWAAKCIEDYDKYKGVQEMMPKAFAVSAKSYDFDEKGYETTIDYKKMLQIIKKANYTQYIGVEYEGNRLSEAEGILATKNLLIKTAKGL